jgi:hypothetical protein
MNTAIAFQFTTDDCGDFKPLLNNGDEKVRNGTVQWPVASSSTIRINVGGRSARIPVQLVRYLTVFIIRNNIKRGKYTNPTFSSPCFALAILR